MTQWYVLFGGRGTNAAYYKHSIMCVCILRSENNMWPKGVGATILRNTAAVICLQDLHPTHC